jgi:hypothetical protein
MCLAASAVSSPGAVPAAHSSTPSIQPHTTLLTHIKHLELRQTKQPRLPRRPSNATPALLAAPGSMLRHLLRYPAFLMSCSRLSLSTFESSFSRSKRTRSPKADDRTRHLRCAMSNRQREGGSHQQGLCSPQHAWLAQLSARPSLFDSLQPSLYPNHSQNM